MNWQSIKLPAPQTLKEELPPETDWLKEAETAKQKCRTKTKTAEVIYPPYKKVKIKNYTETNL